MEFATGAMSSLLPKLGELLLEEYNLKGKVKKGIGELKLELESMQGALVKVSSVPLDQLDPQVKIWANEVRELSYAIEDSLDSFVTCVKGGESTKTTIKNLLKKAHSKLIEFNARHELADEIKDIESQVREIRERYERYKINDIVANPTSTAVDPRLSALYNKVSDLVGTDGPIDELEKILSEGVATSQKNLKIVSIVGFGGLGKTTLAKALYDKLSQTYQCQGFVPVGQNQEAKKVLRDILFELDKELYKDAVTLDERQMINQLQNFLAGKRYFIVIDDLWDIPTWETIKFAFAGSHPESRIIITTRIIDVATKAGGIYCMKPLSDDNSKMLFHTRTCGDDGVSHDKQPAEVIDKILKKCGGVPLAIITIASLLVGKPSADWSKVYDAIGFGNEDSEVIQNTRKILSFSYYDLPPNLKPCLLYLSMFPEDYFIEKKTLIWRWVIEGFVPDKQGIGSYEIGEISFSKLVNKSLIMLTKNGDQTGCRVHDMVLDFIRTMSIDINFVTVDDMEQHTTFSRVKQPGRIHRLALHGRSGEHNTSIPMEHVRSFNAIMSGASKMPLLSRFKVLRVLVIENCNFPKAPSLEHLGKLVQLRYLGLVKTVVKLPEGIGHDLKFLEVLDITGGLISELPSSIGELNNLRCLLADEGARMKGRIGKLTCLEELQLHSVEECPNFLTDLGKLTNLRVLKIQFDECGKITGKDLGESICNLHKIESLQILKRTFDKTPDFNELAIYVRVSTLENWAPSSKLNILHLQYIMLPRMPPCIDPLFLPLLSDMSLCVEVVHARDLQTLGRFPSLLRLVLLSEDKGIPYTFGSTVFQKLELLFTNTEITLEEGALPRLRSLIYRASAERMDSLVPWNNRCPLLQSVACWLDYSYCGSRHRRAVKSILQEASNRRDFKVDVTAENYNYKVGKLIDDIRWILPGTGPEGEQYNSRPPHQAADIRDVLKTLEARLRDAAAPRVGRYGEQELRGFVTQLKSMLHDGASTYQEEKPDNTGAMESDHYTAVTNDGNIPSKQSKVDNDVATSSRGQEKGAESLP